MADVTIAEFEREGVLALTHFLSSNDAELRQAARDVVDEILATLPELGTRLAKTLVMRMQTIPAQQILQDVADVLTSKFGAHVPRVPSAVVVQFVGAVAAPLRQVGEWLLPYVDCDELELDSIARLAHHEQPQIRSYAHRLAHGCRDRFSLVPLALARLVDSPWADTRAFGMQFVEGFRDGQLSSDTLLALCASVRPDVVEFGERLLTRHVTLANQREVITRLAAFPAPSLQRVTAQLLPRLINDGEALRELQPYLATVLSPRYPDLALRRDVYALLVRARELHPELGPVFAPLLAHEPPARPSEPLVANRRYPRADSLRGVVV